MLGLLILKEIRSSVLTYRFAVTFVLSFVLMLVSMHVMTSHYLTNRDNFKAASDTRQSHIAKYTKIDDPVKRFDELNKLGITSAREPASLSILAMGLEREIPVEVHQGGWFSQRSDSVQYENPFLRTLTAPDFTFVVGVIFSLLALIFSFDGICGEKEAQTLKLMMSYSVPRHSILLAKWLGGYIVMILPFLTATGLSLLLLALTGKVHLDDEQWVRIGMMVLFSLIYLSLFFTTGLMISTFTDRPATALIISLFLWATLLLAIPNLSIIAAKVAVPVPTYQKIEAEKQRIYKEYGLKMEALSKTMLSYGKDAERRQEELRDERKRRMQELDEYYDNRLLSQTSLCQTFSRLSPFPSFKYLMTELATTGPDSYRQFQVAEKKFRQTFDDYRRALRKKKDDKTIDKNWLKTEELPALIIFKPRLDDSLNNALTDIIILVMLNVICFMGAFVKFLRYDVR
jgi:ABC-type transport system involved in multi-copper enzyme maturation permease subunit